MHWCGVGNVFPYFSASKNTKEMLSHQPLAMFSSTVAMDIVVDVSTTPHAAMDARSTNFRRRMERRGRNRKGGEGGSQLLDVDEASAYESLTYVRVPRRELLGLSVVSFANSLNDGSRYSFFELL